MRISAAGGNCSRLVLMGAVLFLTAVGLAAEDRELLAPVFPGCVSAGTADPGEFLSKGPFEKVVAFYTAEHGAADRQGAADRNRTTGRSAFFRYLPVTHYETSDDGVYVDEMRAMRSSPVNKVFGHLENLMQTGHMDKRAYDRAEETYGGLRYWYFPRTGETDERGRVVSMDRVVYERYQRELDPVVIHDDRDTDHEEMAQKMQELMAQGKFAEAKALAETMGRSHQQNLDRMDSSVSAEAADGWLECLAELEREGYPVKIRIGLTPPR
ncbi:MAG: hypothetical protein ACLFRR_00220 [Spirochaetaceae bacterium]